MVRYGVLGALEVRQEDRLVDVGGRLPRRLLARLLAAEGRPVSDHKLVDTVWDGKPPSSPSKALQVYVSRLRHALPSVSLHRTEGGYQLLAPAADTDVGQFTAITAEARSLAAAGRPVPAHSAFETALRLWRGEPYAEVSGDDDVQAARAALRDLLEAAQEENAAAVLAAGDPVSAAALADALVHASPYRERRWSLLARALYRSGRQADALAAIRRIRALLSEELGVDPGPELRKLESRILQQDPTLLTDDRPSAPPGADRPQPGDKALSSFVSQGADLPPADQPDMESGPQLPRVPEETLWQDPALIVERPVRVTVGVPLPLTSFVGRDREIADLHRLLQTQRLVTVTGVGGVGKSRLAAEAHARMSRAHPDGVWFVELAGLDQPGLLADAVGDVLDAPAYATRPRVELVQEWLRDVDGLLILDNCEHLVDEAAEFAVATLGVCPRLRILTTSRERLGVTGESLLPLEGLSVPEPGDTTPESAGRAAAVRLFVARATAVDPSFALTDDTVTAITVSCQQLDGLPLAIELAAARVNAFAVGEIAVRLDDRFGLLSQGDRTANPRHRTLQAVVDWSFHMLGEAERRVFTWLSVFAGRFDLGWAEQLMADLLPPDDLARLVAALVDKSLLTQQSGRYRMLETLRVYGNEQLAARGELERARNRHAALIAEVTDTLRETFDGNRSGDGSRLRDSMREEFRAAMAWAVARDDATTAMRIAGVSSTYWTTRGPYAVGPHWLNRALNVPGAAPPAVRARALSGMVLMASVESDPQAAIAAGDEAIAIFERTKDDPAGYGLALRRLATVEGFLDNLDRAETLLIRAHEVALRTQSSWLLGWVLTQHGLLVSFRGDWDRAARMSAEAETVLRDVGDPEVLGFATLLGAEAARNLSGPGAGVDQLCAALRALHGADLPWSTSMAFYYAAGFFRDIGRPHDEVMLLAAGIELRRSTGGPFWLRLTRHQDARLAQLKETLGAEEFETHRKTGSTRSVTDLIQHVCAQLPR
jgi:predicted ATPase/DNA-binding SARP family transcriptional activator